MTKCLDLREITMAHFDILSELTYLSESESEDILAKSVLENHVFSDEGKVRGFDHIFYMFVRRLARYDVDSKNELISSRSNNNKGVVDHFLVKKPDGSLKDSNVVKVLIRHPNHYEVCLNSDYEKYRIIFFVKSFRKPNQLVSCNFTYGIAKKTNLNSPNEKDLEEAKQAFNALLDKSDSIKKAISLENYYNYFQSYS